MIGYSGHYRKLEVKSQRAQSSERRVSPILDLIGWCCKQVLQCLEFHTYSSGSFRSTIFEDQHMSNFVLIRDEQHQFFPVQSRCCQILQKNAGLKLSKDTGSQ